MLAFQLRTRLRSAWEGLLRPSSVFATNEESVGAVKEWLEQALSVANTPAPEQRADDATRAAYAIRLAFVFSAWVHRRVETFEFPDGETIRRSMSVDFALLRHPDLKPAQLVAIPISILRKETLHNFSARDAAGAALPVLTKEENGWIASEGLRSLLEEYWNGTPEELRSVLRGIVMGEPEDARRLAKEELRDGGRLDATLRAFATSDVPNASGVSQSLRALIEELADGFLLLVEMPYYPDKRQVVKFSYDSPKDHYRGVYRRVMRFLAWWGFTGRQENIEGIQVGWSQTYHAEIVPPSDMWVAEAVLEEETPETQRVHAASEPIAPNVRFRRPLWRVTGEHRFRPHLRVENMDRSDRGQLELSFHAKTDALILPLVFSAAAISVVLSFVPNWADSLEAETLAAFLLLPFALATYYISGGEHSYVSHALRGVRLAAVIPVIAGLAVLAMLAIGEIGKDVEATDAAITVSKWCGKAAVGVTLGLLIASASGQAGRLTRPALEKLERLMDKWPNRVRWFAGWALVILGCLSVLAAWSGLMSLLYCLLEI